MMTQFATMDDGCRIAFRQDGDEGLPVLVLANSLGTNLAMWEPQMSALVERFNVLRFDMRGHGESDVPQGAYSIDRLGRDVLGLVDALGLEMFNFCGLSLGGMIGQWLAYRSPERVNRLIIANSSAYMGPPANWQTRIEQVEASGMEPLAGGSVARWFTSTFVEARPEAIAPITQMLAETDPVGYMGCCAAIRDMDLRAMASLNRLPTLVIAGDQDPATPIDHSKLIADAAEQARLAILPAAHLSNVEAADQFSQAVIEFLAQ